MKKLFALLIFFSAMTFAAHSQPSKFAKTASNPTSLITNTGTDTLTLFLPGYYDVVSFQPVVTKAASGGGTVGGTCVIYGSLDGVNFKSLGDTLTLSNVSTAQHAIFTHTIPGWAYYRALITGNNTMSATGQIFYTARRQ